ncbi:metal-dependent hydrolase [archaeon]|jgi:membrane-bound metal-dependent hydrolase YbcI (DUF457 family)|nr:metal-dependent hydrolase [archaeon]
MYLFGHLITAWIFGLIIQFFSGTELSIFAWVLLFFGSVLPDSDLFYQWFFNFKIHRTITHSLLFILFVYLLANLISTNFAAVFLATGVFSHIFIDMFSSRRGVMLLWPIRLDISAYGINRSIISTYTIHSFFNKYFILLFRDFVYGMIWLFFLI